MKTKKTQINSGGFHLIWLMPLEGLFAFLILTVSLKFGFGLAILVALSGALITNFYLIKKLKSNHKQKQRLREHETAKLNISYF